MCTGRLKARVPSCTVLTVASLIEHKLCFHKRSTDGSGKADAYFTGNDSDIIWGGLFEFDNSEKGELDGHEGLGYGYLEKEVQVLDPEGSSHLAFLYYADESAIDTSLRPYNWYKRFVIDGAVQHSLPDEYIAMLQKIESVPDSKPERRDINLATRC